MMLICDDQPLTSSFRGLLRCESKPLSINVSTFGTAKVDEEKIQQVLESEEIFCFRPAKLIQALGLMTPKGWCYHNTAAYGHFGRDIFPWEKTDKADDLRGILK
jgi:S-adenosylmethionine synthetase